MHSAPAESHVVAACFSSIGGAALMPTRHASVRFDECKDVRYIIHASLAVELLLHGVRDMCREAHRSGIPLSGVCGDLLLHTALAPNISL